MINHEDEDTHEKTYGRRVNLRITDPETCELLDDLQKFTTETLTAIINRALDIGMKTLYTNVLGRKSKRTFVKSEDGLGNNTAVRDVDIVSIKLQLDQHTNTLNICETLLTVLYNIAEMDANDEHITAETFTSGVLDQLPDKLSKIKQGMLKEKYKSRARIKKRNATSNI
jgi:hypothetical protein